MPEWKAKVDVSDVFHNHDLSLTDKAQTIAARLGRVAGRIDPGSDEMTELLEELCDAASSDDEAWFNNVWSGIYDWADENRVWIDTFRKSAKTDPSAMEAS